MVVLVVSDVHLGYDNSNVDDFNAFLQYVNERADVDTLVILGDLVDMWRRDISGVFLENHETLKCLLELKERKKIYYVVGNHDFHLLHLVDNKYPFEFKPYLTLPGEDLTYVFRHGWEFDLGQPLPPIMNLLSENTSDKGGQIRSDIWKVITGITNITNFIRRYSEQYQNKYMQKGYLKSYAVYPQGISQLTMDETCLTSLLQPPFERLAGKLDAVERKAANSVEDGQLLVFGHTHRPFYSSTQHLVNTGSWVRDENTFNSWVELDGDDVHVKQYPHAATTITLAKQYPHAATTYSKAIKRIADITNSKTIKRTVS